MILSNTDKLIREYIDLTDQSTLHDVALALESSDQNQLLVALTSKLYDKIQERADKIDYSTIARSRGDITKVDHYNSLMECLDIIHKIVEEYKQDTYPVDVVFSAVDNIKARTDVFRKAFIIGSKVPMMIYNNIVLAIVTSVSFLIATTIEFVKNPGAETYQMALDVVAYNKTKDNLLFQNLASFNEACAKSEIDSALMVVLRQSTIKRESMEVEIKPDTPFLSDEEIDDDEAVIHDNDREIQHESIGPSMIARAVIFVVKLLVNCIRTLVYYFFYSKQKISDYFEVQADLLDMNAYRVQYDATLDEASRKKIFEKQSNIANKMRKIANKFSIDYNVSKKNALDHVKTDEEKYKSSDIGYNPNMEGMGVYNSSIF